MEAPLKPLVHGLTLDELTGICAEAGTSAYRARQIWEWLYRQFAIRWEDMTNLPASLRSELTTHLAIESATAGQTEGQEGATRKILVGLRDGEQIEEVLIPARDRKTVCVSSQVGCRFNCAFCASGKAGFRRDLEAGEMVGEVVLAARSYGERPSHVVFMGTGEPFDNYDAVLKAVRILNAPDGMAIGARRITISTAGVIPGIQRLAGESLQVELSVSLHAPDDALRCRLMPVSRKYPLEALMEACRDYVQLTRRIITFEYTLIRDVNDTRQHAESLARLLRRLQCRVNLIPLSAVDEFEGRRSTPEAEEMFVRALDRARINATVRASKGTGLNAACGQLRLRHMHHE